MERKDCCSSSGLQCSRQLLHKLIQNLKLPVHINPKGLEGTLVKKALKAGYKEGIYSDYSKDVIRPSAQECAQNGRARSTKMRWAIKSE